jgi:hypothetical protein
MPFEPQPVPPIFQPEIIADAVYYAAHHKRREIYVGASTVQAIIGQKFIPGLLDKYLSRAAWEGQFTNALADTTRPDNLFEPVDVDLGAHGSFDARSRRRDYTSALTTRAGAAGVRALVLTFPLLAAGVLLGKLFAGSHPRRALASE